MSRIVKFVALASFAVVVGACAPEDEKDTTNPCPAVTGDRHLAVATVTPGGYQVMLHTVGFACPTVGANIFALYPMSKMAAHAPADFSAQAMTSGTTAPGPDALLAIESVKIMMPAMGHGPAKPPVVSDAKPNQFTADFQMPGSWRAELTFVASAVTTTEQSAVLDFTVQ